MKFLRDVSGFVVPFVIFVLTVLFLEHLFGSNSKANLEEKLPTIADRLDAIDAKLDHIIRSIQDH